MTITLATAYMASTASSFSHHLACRSIPKLNSIPLFVQRYKKASSRFMTSSSFKASSRGQKSVQLLPSYLKDSRAVVKYDPINAPNGAIALSVAENPMVEESITKKLNEIISKTKFTSDQIYYQPTQGRADLIESMSNYLQSLLKLPVPPSSNGIVIGAGCNAVLENLIFTLTELGDGVLIPTPYYAAFEFDLVARIGCKVVPLPTMEYSRGSKTGTDPMSYYPTVEAIDAARNSALQQGITPKVLLLSHPQNPLGIYYPKDVIQECMDYCNTHEIHLVSDEIYAGSVYGDNESSHKEFNSILKNVGQLGDFIHFTYAFSKDFALSGLRVGVSYTENEQIQFPLQKLNDLCSISSYTQVFMKQMLDDSTFIQDYLNHHQSLLKQRSENVQTFLQKHNIPYLIPDSGFFIWMDLSKFNFSTERDLYLKLMNDYGLIFTPGQSMKSELEFYFRFVFCTVKDPEFILAMQRFEKFILDHIDS